MYEFSEVRITADRKGLVSQFTWKAADPRIPPFIGISVAQTARLVGHRHFLMNPGTNENQEFELSASAREQSYDEMKRFQAYEDAEALKRGLIKKGEKRPQNQNDMNIAHLDQLAAFLDHEQAINAWGALKRTWAACENGYALPRVFDRSERKYVVVNTYRHTFMPKLKEHVRRAMIG